MRNAKRSIEKLLAVIILSFIPLLIVPTSLFGEEINKKSKEESKSKSDFVLTIKDNLISLNAKDASLGEIVDELGSRMKINVVARTSKEEKITIKFDRLPLENAIERLREYADIVFIKDLKKEKETITKIIVFSKKKGTVIPGTNTKESEITEERESPVEPESDVKEETVEKPSRGGIFYDQ